MLHKWLTAYAVVRARSKTVAEQQLSHYWQPRRVREKKILLWGGISLLLCGYYWAIWQPLSHQIDYQSGVLRQQQALMMKMNLSAADIMARSKRSAALWSEKTPSTSLSQVVSRSAQKHHITLTRIQDKGLNIQVWSEPLPFNTLLAWLNELRKNPSIYVTRLVINSATQSGVVNILELELANK
ncbi:MAG: type II secretion system protein GspM [Plesiomonas shigelloides]